MTNAWMVEILSWSTSMHAQRWVRSAYDSSNHTGTLTGALGAARMALADNDDANSRFYRVRNADTNQIVMVR